MREDPGHGAVAASAPDGDVWGDSAGGESEAAGTRHEELVAELEGELAVEHVEGLVEVVDMERRACEIGGGTDLDDRDEAACLLAAQKDAGLK